jgi:hypothetical protein
VGKPGLGRENWGLAQSPADPHPPPVILFLLCAALAESSWLLAGSSSVATWEVENAVFRHQLRVPGEPSAALKAAESGLGKGPGKLER